MVTRFVRSRWGWALAGALLAGVAVGAAWLITSSGDDDGQRKGRVSVSFEPGLEKNDGGLRRVLERTQRRFNDEIRLPADLQIRLVGDPTADRLGISGPTYVPKDRTVYFPRSFVDGARADLKRYGHPLASTDSGAELEDAMRFVLDHELTHGLVDVLDLPIVGGEERAADSLAAIFAIRAQRAGQAIPLSGAGLEEAEARRQGSPGLLQYADDHELDRERQFDALCLVYGSNPQRYRSYVDKEGLPQGRAENCPFDYSNELRSWRRLLGAWLTESGGLLPLKR